MELTPDAVAVVRFRVAGRAAAWPNRSPAGSGAAGMGTMACRRRHIGGDGCQQPGGRGDGCPCVDRNALGIGGIAIDYGQPGIEGRAAPGVGAPVDSDGKDGARRRIEPFEGAAPGGIAGDAAGRCDRHQPPARRKHGEGGTEVTQIRLMADALDPGACRERRVHQHHGGMQAGQIVADGLGVVAGDRRVREQGSRATRRERRQSRSGAGDSSNARHCCACRGRTRP